HGVRTARSEGEVVLGAAALVAMPFDADLRARPFLHPVGVLLEPALRVLADLRLVEIEEDVVERPLVVELCDRFARKDLLLGEGTRRGRRCRRWWRRRWRRSHGCCGRRRRRWRGGRRGYFLVAAGHDQGEDQ